MAIFDKSRNEDVDPAEAERIADQKRAAQIEFDRLHTEGALRFGWLWYEANKITSKHIDTDWLAPSVFDMDIRFKALLSSIAWDIAEALRAAAAGDAPESGA